MKLLFSKVDFSILKFSPQDIFSSELQTQLQTSQDWISLTRTQEELSLVCSTSVANKITHSFLSREDGWISFSVEGPLDFSITGLLASISKTLAEAGVSLFAISTFDTDIILIKKEKNEVATAALRKAGYKTVSI